MRKAGYPRLEWQKEEIESQIALIKADNHQCTTHLDLEHRHFHQQHRRLTLPQLLALYSYLPKRPHFSREPAALESGLWFPSQV
jgi:hypothetical protein